MRRWARPAPEAVRLGALAGQSVEVVGPGPATGEAVRAAVPVGLTLPAGRLDLERIPVSLLTAATRTLTRHTMVSLLDRLLDT